jgi:thioredoxin reductase/NAD-dependent dihydropyrimidine dehydrogenase PreA subunit
MLIVVLVILTYLRTNKKKSDEIEVKIKKAKEFGFYEPMSLHPVIDYDICIGSGACVAACPEHDILGIVNGKGTPINSSRCVGHGACFHACPVQAISLCIGTEKRGVDLPHISREFETTIPGLFIAGELGGMGLIKNAVEQGKQAVDYLSQKITPSNNGKYDVIIVGAGPAGISASLEAKKRNLKFLTLEQDTLGGTVSSFPRQKIVMTNPMDLPLFGKVKLYQTSKSELLKLWEDVLTKNNISIKTEEKVDSINKNDKLFEVITPSGNYKSSSVLLAIGRRGSPRKLDVPGENKEKVAYRLIEPEFIKNLNILVVGGGDSAVESALLLADAHNNVTLSYRSDKFARLKPLNLDNINLAVKNKRVKVIFNSNVKEIFDDKVRLFLQDNNEEVEIRNDLVYVFAGGVLPTKFLEEIGIRITKKFGDAILKHSRS